MASPLRADPGGPSRDPETRTTSGAGPELVIKTHTSPGITRTSTAIDVGGLTDITGTIEKAPPRARARTQWSSSADEATRLAQQGRYIETTIAYYVQR